MEIPAKKILRLLEPDRPAEVRCAAAVVLGEVGARDAEVSRALLDRLDDEDQAVRLRVIRAVGKLRVGEALTRLIDRVADGGEESHEAVEAAARLGPKGTRALQDL